VLAVLFRQGVKGTELRERTLDFITTNVLAAAETLFKDAEIELFFLEEMQKVLASKLENSNFWLWCGQMY
jgi:hypothetical protein